MRNIAFKGSVRAGLLALGCAVGFASAEAAQTGLRIAHIADPQVGFITSRIPSRSEANYAANYARDLEYVKAMIPLVNAEHPDLVLIAGDLMQNATDLAAEWPALLQKFDAPVLIAPGNHDMGNNVTAANLERFRTLFGAAWTSRSLNGYRIIVMNSQFWYATDGSTAANDAKQAHDAWLDAEIAAAVAAGEKIILCSHIPPFESTVDEADSYFNCPKATRTAFMDRLIANGVDYWLCGHTHTKTQHQYANASGTLNIWTAEAVCENFDGTPSGFQVFEIPAGQTTATWRNVPITLPVRPLGEGFLPLEYVQTDGSKSYFDLGIAADPTTVMTLDGQLTTVEGSGGRHLMGCTVNGASSESLSLAFFVRGDGYFGACMNDGTSMSSQTTEMTADTSRHLFVLDVPQGKCFIGSAEKISFGAVEKSTAGNLYLGAQNRIGTGFRDASYPLRIYSFTLVKGGEIKMELVPVLRISDGAVGLYDRAGQGFLPPAAGVLEAGPTKLEDVEELEYIQADGNQYIDTGYKPNAKSQIYFKFATFDIEKSVQLFGCASGNNRLRVMRRKVADATTDGLCFVDMSNGGENFLTKVGMPDSDIHEIFASNASKTYDGEEFGTTATKPLTATIDKTLYLMKWNNFEGGVPFSGRVYACKISEDNAPKMDLVPARIKSTNVAGLYDRVSGRFLTNAGTGKFIPPPSAVSVDWRGHKLTVGGTIRNPSESLCLCWGAEDGGVGKWAHARTLATDMPMGDFEQVLRMGELGIKKTDCVRAFVGKLKEISLVEYVQTDGSKSYFDIGTGADPTTVMTLDGMPQTPITTTGYHLMGCTVNGATTESLSFAAYIKDDKFFGACMNDGKSMASVSAGILANTQRHLFVLDAPQKKYFIDNTERVAFDGAVTLATAGNIYLGGQNRIGTGILQRGKVRVYSFSMVKGGTLIRDLVPAKDNGEACLYDTVSGKFFKNAGSGGTITAPAEVSRVIYGVTDITASATATRIPNGLIIGIF